LYKASAKLEYPAAQNNLGVIYENGMRLSFNACFQHFDSLGETGKPLMKEAYDMFCLAAARGLSTAINNKVPIRLLAILFVVYFNLVDVTLSFFLSIPFCCFFLVF
jgi:TPR repeat protein